MDVQHHLVVPGQGVDDGLQPGARVIAARHFDMGEVAGQALEHLGLGAARHQQVHGRLVHVR
ncbi:hypothetical protein D3C80_2134590 [compost metagenome]